MIQFVCPPKKELKLQRFVLIHLYPETWGNDTSWIMIILGFVFCQDLYHGLDPFNNIGSKHLLLRNFSMDYGFSLFTNSTY